MVKRLENTVKREERTCLVTTQSHVVFFVLFFVSVATGTTTLVWVAVHGNLLGKRVRMNVQGKGKERQG